MTTIERLRAVLVGDVVDVETDRSVSHAGSVERLYIKYRDGRLVVLDLRDTYEGTMTLEARTAAGPRMAVEK